MLSHGDEREVVPAILKAVFRQPEYSPVRQFNRFLQRADPQLRSLQVDEQLRGDAAQRCGLVITPDEAGGLCEALMGGVQAHACHAFLYHFFQD